MRIPIEDGKSINIPGIAIGGVVVLILVLILAISSLFQVDTGARGVVLRFGERVRTAEPGLHLKLPYPVEQVYTVQTRLMDVVEFGYRAQADRGQGTPSSREESSMLTGDLNIIHIGWDVQFRRTDPEPFLFNVKAPVDTLRDISQSVMRELAGNRGSIPILTVGRAEIRRRAKTLIQEYVNKFDMGLSIQKVNLVYVRPPNEVIDAFNDLNKAEQDAVRFYEEAARKYEERIPKAKGDASRRISEAKGYKAERVNVAQGEANRFSEVLTAYKESSKITRRRLYLETMEKVLPRVNDVTIVDDSVPSVLPHFNLKSNKKSSSSK